MEYTLYILRRIVIARPIENKMEERNREESDHPEENYSDREDDTVESSQPEEKRKMKFSDPRAAEMRLESIPKNIRNILFTMGVANAFCELKRRIYAECESTKTKGIEDSERMLAGIWRNMCENHEDRYFQSKFVTPGNPDVKEYFKDKKIIDCLQIIIDMAQTIGNEAKQRRDTVDMGEITQYHEQYRNLVRLHDEMLGKRPKSSQKQFGNQYQKQYGNQYQSSNQYQYRKPYQKSPHQNYGGGHDQGVYQQHRYHQGYQGYQDRSRNVDEYPTLRQSSYNTQRNRDNQ